MSVSIPDAIGDERNAASSGSTALTRISRSTPSTRASVTRVAAALRMLLSRTSGATVSTYRSVSMSWPRIHTPTTPIGTRRDATTINPIDTNARARPDGLERWPAPPARSASFSAVSRTTSRRRSPSSSVEGSVPVISDSDVITCPEPTGADGALVSSEIGVVLVRVAATERRDGVVERTGLAQVGGDGDHLARAGVCAGE